MNFSNQNHSENYIVLGTAQFGSNYGITNENNILHSEAREILEFAQSVNINSLDTAYSYQNSESIIGSSYPLSCNFKISSKFPSQSDKYFSKDSKEQWNNIFKTSLLRLKISSLDTYFIHNINDLKKDGRDLLLEWLLDLKQEGLIRRIGLSIYNKSDLSGIYLDNFDIVQLPLSIYDQTFINNNTIKYLNDIGLKIQARSIFLQGIILQRIDKLPDFFSNEFKQHHHNFYNHLKNLDAHASEYAISFIRSINEIDSFVVGISSIKELKKLYSSFIKSQIFYSSDFDAWHWSIKQDLDPRNWNLSN
tara:strand:- start:2919 stop:3836 length:918 start_codon:yes stop_codon:yes gene_type:complete